jgi:hypothetical protein
MHIAMGRPPTHPKRLLLAVSDEFLAQIDAWRSAQTGIVPTRSDTIRHLVEMGLEIERRLTDLEATANPQGKPHKAKKPRR